MKKQQDNFTKSDLETGMLVQFRRGDIIGLIVNDIIITKDGFMSLNDYEENLLINKLKYDNDVDADQFDIIRISEKLEIPILKYWNKKTLLENLLWERDDVKKQDNKLIEIDGKKYRKRDLKKVINILDEIKPVE